MANNTIMTAKNSFQEGLIMDLSPSNTNALCLTNALNATLLTFNGNELNLLNDMGNARVETARLPEGYIPMGTCEFGDIIYIVSYNPLTNKSQIGCFPSPERIFSQEEVNQLNIDTITYTDFLDTELTGNLKTSNIRKILYDKKVYPGDKYIIAYSGDVSNITDYDTPDKKLNSFPRFLNVRVVTIDDNGKITDLESSVKWYNTDNNKYFKFNKLDDKGEIDIKSYTNNMQSAYNVYSSKVSGKLALLIELEKISDFSCSWEALIPTYTIQYFNSENEPNLYVEWKNTISLESKSKLWYKYNIGNNSIITDKKSKVYDIYLNYSWETKDININPKYAIIEDNYNSDIKIIYSDSNKKYHEFSRKYEPELKNSELYKGNHDKLEPLQQKFNSDTKSFIEGTYNDNIRIEDDIINNEYKIPIRKKLGTFVFPETGEYNYQFEVIPAMPYGKLNELTIKGNIQLNKLGTTDISINTWKYKVHNELLTLKWGLNVYLEPSTKIDSIDLEFYDNDGITAVLSETVGTQFISYIPLNKIYEKFNNFYKINNSNTTFKHGLKISDPYSVSECYTRNSSKTDKGYTYTLNTDTINTNVNYYIDNSKILYSNLLYLVKIIVRTKLNLSSLLKEHIYYKWLWTNGQYNLYYNNINYSDFTNCKFNLNLDIDVAYNSTKPTINYIDNINVNIDSSERKISKYTQTIERDINAYLGVKIPNYVLDENKLNNLNVNVIIANNNVTRSIDYPDIKFYKSEISNVKSLQTETIGNIETNITNDTETESNLMGETIKMTFTKNNNIYECNRTA